MDPQTLTSNRSLPFAFRGYSRDAVNELLHEVEQGYRRLLGEHDALKSLAETLDERVSELSSELDISKKREQAVADALITAHEQATQLVAAAHKRAEIEASELLEAAHSEAARLIQELSARQHRTEALVEDMTHRLRVFIRSIYGSSPTAPTTQSVGPRDDGQQPDLRLAGS